MMLIGEEPAPPPDALSIGLGIAAVILVAGWVLMRWHRDRMRFAIMKTALERGVTRFPGTPPYWLVSLRQGVTFIALGAGLGIVGSGAWWMAHGVAMPTPPVAVSSTQPAGPSTAAPARGPLPEGRPLRPEDRGFDRPLRPDGSPPPREDDERPGPPPRREAPPPTDREGGRAAPRIPSPHDPVMEQWHRAEAQQTIGLVSVRAGFILLLLGIVRIGFAKVEQRYMTDSEESTLY